MSHECLFAWDYVTGRIICSLCGAVTNCLTIPAEAPAASITDQINWKARAETAEAALAQAQQALRDSRGIVELLVHELRTVHYCPEEDNCVVTDILAKAEKWLAEGALPSDTQGAQLSEKEK